MSKKEDRLNRLIEILKRQNGATIRDLAQMLDVSEMTVRRDLDALKAKNVILDIPGAAVLNTQYTYEGGRRCISTLYGNPLTCKGEGADWKVCRFLNSAG